MKRVLLIVVLVAACLGLFVAPASAFYAPQKHTAYITSFVGAVDPDTGQWVDWVKWNGPSDPYGLTEMSGPIPYGWNVVVTREWFDSKLGATLIPTEYFNTMAVSSSTGCWRFAITKAACGLRYWSPAYEFGDDFPAGTWARDWWVPLGKLRPGDYSGWVTQFAPRAIPSWLDWENWVILPLLHPIMNQPADLNWTQDISFTVAPPAKPAHYGPQRHDRSRTRASRQNQAVMAHARSPGDAGAPRMGRQPGLMGRSRQRAMGVYVAVDLPYRPS